MTLHFAIHGHCLIRKVKWWHWLGEVDFCCVRSFALPSRYFLQKITTIYLNLSKLCPKYCRSVFSRTRYIWNLRRSNEMRSSRNPWTEYLAMPALETPEICPVVSLRTCFLCWPVLHCSPVPATCKILQISQYTNGWTFKPNCGQTWGWAAS